MQVDDVNHTGDISIGPDEWIEVNPRSSSDAIDITEILNPISLFTYLEIHCSSTCCQFEAFDFWPDVIIENIKYLDPGIELTILKEARNALLELPSNDLKSIVFNSYFKKNSVVQLLDHCIKVIENA